MHVSGAIAVWMFARQVLLRAAGPAGDIHARLAGVNAELAAVKANYQKQFMEFKADYKVQYDELLLKMADLKSRLPEKYRKQLEEKSRQTPPPPGESSKTSSEGR